MREIRGIANMRTRQPVQAVLRVGVKDRRGVPIEKDRFFFCDPVERNGQFESARGTFSSLYRPLHPDFADYHKLPPDQRRSVRGVLIHDRPEAGAWEYSLGAQALPAPWPAHPDRAPACLGNGKIAVRFFGNTQQHGFANVEVGTDGYAEIPCTDKCPFLDGDRLCRPKGRLLFRLAQPGLPEAVVRIATQSWFNVETWQGFFDHVEEQGGALMAGEVPNLYGLSFFLRLTERSTPKGTFPVVTMTPAVDLQIWLMRQRARLQQLQGVRPDVPRLSDPDQRAAAGADFGDIVPAAPALPAAPDVPALLAQVLEVQRCGTRAELERVRAELNAVRQRLAKDQQLTLRAAYQAAENAVGAREQAVPSYTAQVAKASSQAELQALYDQEVLRLQLVAEPDRTERLAVAAQLADARLAQLTKPATPEAEIVDDEPIERADKIGAANYDG